METIYNIDYFFKKFEAIPEDKFLKWSFRSSCDYTKRCFMGHCLPDEAVDLILSYGRNINGNCAAPKETFQQPIFYESAALAGLFYDHFKASTVMDATHLIYKINNGEHPKYQQSTIKQRILAALYDIKESQQPEVKERIVYVTVDEPVRGLQKKELIEN